MSALSRVEDFCVLRSRPASSRLGKILQYIGRSDKTAQLLLTFLGCPRDDQCGPGKRESKQLRMPVQQSIIEVCSGALSRLRF